LERFQKLFINFIIYYANLIKDNMPLQEALFMGKKWIIQSKKSSISFSKICLKTDAGSVIFSINTRHSQQARKLYL
jgi:hypothetical protein